MFVSLVDQVVGRIGKVTFQVNLEDSALPSVTAIMPGEVLLDPVEVPVQPLPDLAGSIVVYHAGGIERYKDLVAEGLVHLPVCDVRRINGPYLPALA